MRRTYLLCLSDAIFPNQPPAACSGTSCFSRVTQIATAFCGTSLCRRTERQIRPQSPRLVSHRLRLMLEHNKVVLQFATVVFARANVRFNAASQKRCMRLQSGGIITMINDRKRFVVGRCSRERACFFCVALHQRLMAGPIAPIVAIENKLRRINRLLAQQRRVRVLALGPIARGEPIAPAQAVPVIDMKRERHKVYP